MVESEINQDSNSQEKIQTAAFERDVCALFSVGATVLFGWNAQRTMLDLAADVTNQGDFDWTRAAGLLAGTAVIALSMRIVKYQNDLLEKLRFDEEMKKVW